MAAQHSGQANKRSSNIHIGIIVFAIIFIKILVSVVSYFNTKHIIPYEVKKGSLSSNNIYQGIALRDETICTGTDSGYVNYYVREGTHVAVGDLVYTVDEMKNAASDAPAQTDSQLSEEDLAKMRGIMSNFSSQFDEAHYKDTYSLKSNIQSKVVELANYEMLANANRLESTNSHLVHYNYAGSSGVVVYHTDGFENLRFEALTNEMFDTENYTEVAIKNSDLIDSGEAVYKICTNEDWSIAIPVEKAMADLLVEKEYVEVKFLKNQYKSWASVSSFTNANDETFVKLSFTNSMITFSTERFINIELLLENESGLKIPNTSIAEKEFFMVPKEYITKGGKQGKEGVLKEVINDEGNVTSQFVQTSIYSETDTEYYLDDMALRIGDRLIMPDSTESFIINERDTGSLIGVYNINKGYAEFREINILYQNDDYAIVKPNTTYGLSVYDYIILDAESVSDNEMLYGN